MLCEMVVCGKHHYKKKQLVIIQRIGKKRDKRSVLTYQTGLPLVVVLSGANTNVVNLLEETLEHILVLRPVPTEESPQNLCLDTSYTGHEEEGIARGYSAHIRPRGEEKKELETNSDFKARRWVIEVAYSWLNRFRKLLVRFEKKSENYLGLVQITCALLVWRILYVHA